MKITETGQYVLTMDFAVRNTISSAILQKGCVVAITQVDKAYKKVYGPDLMDWVYWDLPLEALAEKELECLKERCEHYQSIECCDCSKKIKESE